MPDAVFLVGGDIERDGALRLEGGAVALSDLLREAGAGAGDRVQVSAVLMADRSSGPPWAQLWRKVAGLLEEAAERDPAIHAAEHHVAAARDIVIDIEGAANRASDLADAERAFRLRKRLREAWTPDDLLQHARRIRAVHGVES